MTQRAMAPSSTAGMPAPRHPKTPRPWHLGPWHLGRWPLGRWPLALAVVLGLLAGGPAVAQDPPQDKKPFDVKIETEGGQDYITLSINEEDGIPVEDFIKLAQKMTNKTLKGVCSD